MSKINMQKIKKVNSSKLNNPATLNDLNKVEKKLTDRLDLCATLNNLNKLDKKLSDRIDHLDKKTDKMLVEILNLKEGAKNYYTRQEAAEFRDEMLTVMDVVVKKLDNIESSFVSNQAAHDRFERRITKTEQHLESIR